MDHLINLAGFVLAYLIVAVPVGFIMIKWLNHRRRMYPPDPSNQ